MTVFPIQDLLNQMSRLKVQKKTQPLICTTQQHFQNTNTTKIQIVKAILLKLLFKVSHWHIYKRPILYVL